MQSFYVETKSSSMDISHLTSHFNNIISQLNSFQSDDAKMLIDNLRARNRMALEKLEKANLYYSASQALEYYQ